MSKVSDIANTFKSGFFRGVNYVKNPFLTGLNILGTATGSWRKIYNSDALEAMSGEARAKLVDDYNESLGLMEGGLPRQDGFDNYMGSRIAGVDDFSAVKAPNNKSISEILAGAGAGAAAKAIKDQISDCFTPTEETKAKRAKFNVDIKEIHEFVKHSKANYHPRDLINYLHNIKNDASKSIKSQQAEEKKNLEALFEKEEFKTPFKECLAINDDQLNRVKKEMLQALDKSHQEKLAVFEKEMDGPIKQMHTAAQVERERVAFLAALYNGNKEARAAIEALHERKKQEGSIEVALSDDGGVNKAVFKGINVKDLGDISTITGRKIKNNGDGSFSMSLPNHFFTLSPMYYLSSDHKLKQDLMAIPLAIRAAGYSAITMTVTRSHNEEGAKETAREAYVACIEAGFDDKNISLMVNGKKISNDELFASCPQRRQMANKIADRNKKQWIKDDALPSAGEPAEVSRSFRNKLQEFIEKESAPMPVVEAGVRPPLK